MLLFFIDSVFDILFAFSTIDLCGFFYFAFYFQKFLYIV